MPDTKITALASITGANVADNDVVPLVDISDTSMAATGTDKQITVDELRAAIGRVPFFADLQDAAWLYDDFITANAATGDIGCLGWTAVFGGAGAITIATAPADDVAGQVNIGTGTTAGSTALLHLGGTALRGAHASTYECRCKVSNLNDGTNQFSVYAGLTTDTAGAEPSSGHYFRYTNADGVNWQAVTANGGSRTVTNSGVAVSASAMQRLGFIGDGAGNVSFYIAGALVATHSTNLIGASVQHAPSLSIVKTASTGARTFQVDYMALRWGLTR